MRNRKQLEALRGELLKIAAKAERDEQGGIKYSLLEPKESAVIQKAIDELLASGAVLSKEAERIARGAGFKLKRKGEAK